MEFGLNRDAQDKSDITSNHGREDVQSEVAMTENSQEQPHPSPAIQNIDMFRKHEVPAPRDASGEVNMEVSVTADDVIRAGGFGTSDSISSLLPVASDFTDFEDHLQRVQGYEDSVDKIAGGKSDPSKEVQEVGKVHVKDIDNGEKRDAFEAVNMEASVTSDEMIRAGGFGATDNISSFLPVASDFTDFEAYLRDAREYEGLDEEINRPGLGWNSEAKKNKEEKAGTKVKWKPCAHVQSDSMEKHFSFCRRVETSAGPYWMPLCYRVICEAESRFPLLGLSFFCQCRRYFSGSIYLMIMHIKTDLIVIPKIWKFSTKL